MYIQSNCIQAGLKIFEKDPEIRIHEDCFYIPKLTEFHDHNYGIYDLYARLVQTAGPRRGWPNEVLGQSQNCIINPTSNHPLAPESCYFYGGHIGSHFGHFITETLPRYWCNDEFYKKFKILIHSGGNLDTLFTMPWVKGFFDMLGLQKENFIIFNRPTRIEKLIVAGTSFEENHFAHNVFANFCNTLGNIFSKKILDKRPVYLSRANFNSQLRSIKGEKEVEEILSKRDFNIIYPETLSLKEQMGLFSSERPTCGFIGSAFHNSIFCQSPLGISLCYDDEYSSNFYLMDQINKANISYLLTPTLNPERNLSSHKVTYKIQDPISVANLITDLVKNKIDITPTNTPTVFKELDKIQSFYVKTSHDTCLFIDKQTGLIRHEKRIPTQSDANIVICHKSTTKLIKLTTRLAECLTLNADNNTGKALYYTLYQNEDGSFSFIHPQSNRVISAIPDGSVICNRKEISQWEKFLLVPNPP